MADEPYPVPGRPYKIESYYSADFEHRWKLVPTDDMIDIDGEIVAADVVMTHALGSPATYIFKR